MKKLISTLIATITVVGSVVTVTTPYDEPDAAVGIDPYYPFVFS